MTKRTSKEKLDLAIHKLKSNKDVWASEVSISKRIQLLKSCSASLKTKANEWVELDLKNRQIPERHWDSLTTVACVAATIRLIRLYTEQLETLEQTGKMHLPVISGKRGNDQISVQVFPTSVEDRLLFLGFTGEIWMEPGIKEDDLTALQGVYYSSPPQSGKVCAVLGAGNISAISIADTMYKLIVEKKCVLLKIHPITEYIGVIIESSFEDFIKEGYLQVVYGTAEEGAYVCNNADIDEVHITGSDKTYEAIVFGTGEEGKANKLSNNPVLKKPITSELGNVSPVIIVPGPWKKSDLTYQASHLASGLCFNGGYNCLTNRILIQKENDMHRQDLLHHLQHVLKTIPNTYAFYPGTEEKINHIINQKTGVLTFGSHEVGKTPWTLLLDLKPGNDEFCYGEEIFGSFMAEACIAAASTEEYLDQAVTFCNERLWGNLCATIIIHPQSYANPSIKKAVEKAIADLRYGTVSINQSPGISYLLGSTTWGAFPGNTDQNIQSGRGVVHNSFMLEKVQKSIVMAPFKSRPLPMWFPTNPQGLKAAYHYLNYEKKRNFVNLAKTIMAAVMPVGV